MKNFLTSKITRRRLEVFLDRYASDKSTLDLGCAGQKYAKYFPNRVGFDINPGEGVDVVGDAHSLPFSDNHFDVILCTEVLEHLHTPAQAVSEMHRVLKPGGLLVLSTRFIFPLHDTPNDFYRYTKYGLRHLFQTGWDILELTEEASTKDTFAVLLQRVGFQSQLRFNRFLKTLIFLLARFVAFLPSPILREYGSIKRDRKESDILTSGYYLACKKKQQ